jgi:hypothetical protein
MLIFALVSALGFGVLYAQTAFARIPSAQAALLGGAIATLAFLVSFLLPPRWFHYTNADVAPRVMSQVIARAAVGALIVLGLNALIWFAFGASVSLLEELLRLRARRDFAVSRLGWRGCLATWSICNKPGSTTRTNLSPCWYWSRSSC